MGFEHIDEACLAGQRAENADFHASAAISPLKIAKRKIYVSFPLPISAAIISGATAINVSGAFGGIVFPDSGSSTITLAGISPRGEIGQGELGTLNILWRCSGSNTGNLRLVAELKTAIQGISTLATAITRNVIQAANGTLSSFQIAKMIFPVSVFNNNQLWGIKLTRDPTNTLDTIGGDVAIKCVWMEILGRC